MPLNLNDTRQTFLRFYESDVMQLRKQGHELMPVHAKKLLEEYLGELQEP